MRQNFHQIWTKYECHPKLVSGFHNDPIYTNDWPRCPRLIYRLTFGGQTIHFDMYIFNSRERGEQTPVLELNNQGVVRILRVVFLVISRVDRSTLC